MQNLKRGSFLREAIMAPEGHQIVVADLSQIEVRVLAWLAGYQELMDVFAAGGDPYASFGAQMFSIPGLTKHSHPDLRQSAKSALLGCFGSQTLVLTKRGWVTIVSVTTEDLLWDGEEWVRHQGLLEQGEKEVITAKGLTATSDHEILTERGWQAWSAVLQNPSLFRSALSLASLPVLAGNDKEVLPPLKQRMQTYDIALAGPRNRYTVLTDEGPLIVHNCGYQMGWASFAAQLLTGFLGAAPVMYDMAFAKKLGVDGTFINKFLGYEPNVEALLEIPHICTEKELLTHCLASKAIIDTYRRTAYPIVDFWGLCEGLIKTALFEGKPYVHKCLTFVKEAIILPNGMRIHYPHLRQEKDEDSGRLQWVYGLGRDKTSLYPGKVTNNVTQAVARIVMTDGMLRVQKKYPVVGTVHDELLAVVPDAEVDFAKTWVLAEMTRVPDYLPGINLDADGGAHRRYGLAKG
jgi:DNA polymerase